MRHNESLGIVWERIVNESKEIKLPLIEGFINQKEDLSEVVCSYNDSRDVLSFFELARSSRANCIVFNKHHLSKEEAQEALNILKEEDAESDDDKATLLIDLKKAIKNPNQLSYISLNFLTENSTVIYILEILTEAHRYVAELNEEDDDLFDDDYEIDDDDDDEKEAINNSVIKKMARDRVQELFNKRGQ